MRNLENDANLDDASDPPRQRRRPTPMSRRRWAWLIGALALTLIAATAVLAATFPVVSAMACPRCYGLTPLTSNVYIEATSTARVRHQAWTDLAAATEQIRQFYGGTESSPRILLCRTERCYHSIGGGGEKGQALRNWALILSPAGMNPVIAAHELEHVEFHQRLGAQRGKVPHWFDEGLAVLVSNDPRYLAPEAATDRCLTNYSDALTVTTGAWSNTATTNDRSYLKAACVVSRWVTANGGARAVLDLIHRITHGDAFTSIVRS
jgi:hypothetical protein